MAITKNIVTDYSCPTNGTSDCRAAFLSFKSDVQGQDATLTIPAGTYNFKHNAGATANSFPFDGIPNLIVSGYGAIITNDSGAGEMGLGTITAVSVGIPQSSARIQTAIRGSSSVLLVTLADNSVFSVGRWIAITAGDLQGAGQPPNPMFCEYRQITAINTGTGVIGFTQPLKDTYISTLPHYANGTINEPDEGGPGTIYLMPSNWNANLEFRGLTFNIVGGSPWYAKGREVKFLDCTTVTGTIIPTANKKWTLSGSAASFPVITEFDKMLEEVVIEDGAFFDQPFIQSSFSLLTIDNGDITTLNCTPRHTVVKNGSTIGAVNLGVSYGRSEYYQQDGGTIGAFSVVSTDNPLSNYAGSGSILTNPGVGIPPFAIPGTNMTVSGQYSSEAGFTIGGVTINATNDGIIMYTTLTDAAAMISTLPGASKKLRSHPCPRLRLTNVTGCAKALDWSQPGAYDRPYASYSKRSYDQTMTAGQEGVPVWGRLTSLKINVVQAYSGAALGLLRMSRFANFPVILPDYSTSTYGPVINLKIAGERIITPSGVTGTQTGDTGLALPNALAWFTGDMTPYIDGDLSAGTMFVTIEYIMDQGVIKDSSTRLSLRAHS